MSLATSLQPIPSNTGEPVSVERIESTGKLRITRRFSCPPHLTRRELLPKFVGPYGTADGASWAGIDAGSVRSVDPAQVWADALLVECDIVASPARSPQQAGENAAERWVVCVYEQTPYTRTTGSQTDAQGAILSQDKTVVLSVGQSLAAASPGYSRVVISSSSDKGRITYQVRDVLGEGPVSKGFSENGDGVIEEEGSYTTMTEPEDPAPGLFETWRSVAEGGYWRVSYTRAAEDQLPAPGRVKRDRSSQPDGAIHESVTESGADPACAHTADEGDWIQIGESNFTRQGGLVGRTKRWLRMPAERTRAMLVEWQQPGVASLGGTTGDAFLRIDAGCTRRLAGTVQFAYPTGSVSVDVPWQIASGFYCYVGGTVKDADGNPVPLVRDETHPNVVGSVSLSTGSGGKWSGMDIAGPFVVDGSSTPAALPSGEFVADCDIREYAADLDGVIRYEKRTVRASL